MLVPLLGDQLVNLTISNSINWQVPYLLRSVLPNGLPSLRSLGITQRESMNYGEARLPGCRWREDEDGTIREVNERNAWTNVDSAYITSLARGAPNLEELEVDGTCQSLIVRTCSPECIFADCAIARRLPFPRSQTSNASMALEGFLAKIFATSRSVTRASSPSPTHIHRSCTDVQRSIEGRMVPSF
jgi:hypothetical protein